MWKIMLSSIWKEVGKRILKRQTSWNIVHDDRTLTDVKDSSQKINYNVFNSFQLSSSNIYWVTN